jgi:TRAP-type C4-dicarboxylate transport system substrate-binding protein
VTSTHSRTLTSLLAIGIAGALLTTSGCVDTGSSGDDNGGTVTLRVNTGVPPGHHYAKNVWKPWQKKVEEETDGKVEVQIYDGDTLGSFGSALSDLKGNVYDATFVIPEYFEDSDLFPYTIGPMPYAYPDIKTGNRVLEKFVEEHEDEMQEDGVRIAGATVSDLYNIYSTKPVKTVGDLKGMQFRASSESNADLIKAWGASPVQMTTGEVYQGLERGTVDATAYTNVGAIGFKFFEVAPNVSAVNAYGTLVAPAFSEQFLDKLPDDVKSTFDESLIPELRELARATYSKEVDEANETLDSNDNVNIIDMSNSELDDFKKASKPVWEDWMKTADEKGYDGQQLFNDWMELLEDAGGERPF